MLTLATLFISKWSRSYLGYQPNGVIIMSWEIIMFNLFQNWLYLFTYRFAVVWELSTPRIFTNTKYCQTFQLHQIRECGILYHYGFNSNLSLWGIWVSFQMTVDHLYFFFHEVPIHVSCFFFFFFSIELFVILMVWGISSYILDTKTLLLLYVPLRPSSLWLIFSN